MKRVTLTITVLLLYIAVVNGVLFPLECVENVKTWPVTCCPDFNGSPCGKDLLRGNCLPTITSRAMPPITVRRDERDSQFSVLFNMTCQCKSNFTGYKCGECAFGWTGDNCDIKHKILRRNILNMSDTDVGRFLSVMQYCKTKLDPEFAILRTADRFRIQSYEFIRGSYYDIFAFLHYYATKRFNRNGQEVTDVTFAHGSTGFFSYHRYFLMYLERQIQKCVNDPYFALPFYRWEVDPNCTLCDDKYIGATDINGRISINSAFSDWRLMCSQDYPTTVCMTNDCPCERPKLVRMPGFRSGTFPSKSSVDICMAKAIFDTYPWNGSARDGVRQCIEGLHNSVHGWMGGTMGLVSTSASDIFFVLHHCNVDRLFSIFIEAKDYGPEDYPPCTVYGHTPDECMMPFLPCEKHRNMMRPTGYFGYSYEPY